VGCVTIGALVGAVIGAMQGPKWYRAAEASPLIQRRMLAYMRRRGTGSGVIPHRTMNAISLRRLLGSRRSAQG